MRNTLRALLLRYPRLRLAVAPEKIRWRPAQLVRALKALPVRLRD